MAEAAKVLETAKKPAGPVPVKFTATMDLTARIQQLYDTISRRAFELFENNGRVFGREWNDWFKAESELLHPAHLNIDETAQDVTVKAEVPGFAAQDLNLSLEGTRLTITGKRETKEEKTEKKVARREIHSNVIMRVVDLPAAVDADKAVATLKDGILELRMPKASPPRKIAIEAKTA
jgi:HSP20 family protein